MKKYIGLAIIIIFAISLRLYTFTGYVGLDDAEYARAAQNISAGTFKVGASYGSPVFPLRVGLTFPVAILFKLFGINEYSMVLYPFVLSLLSILLVYFCTDYFFGYRAGLIAALLWSVLPVDLSYNATKLLPDLPSSFYASLAIATILIFIRKQTENKTFIFSGGVLAGLFFGISWLTKASVILLIPLCLIIMLITLKEDFKKFAYLWIGVAVGSLAILIAEMLSYLFITGDLLYRMHETERNYIFNKDGFFSEGSRWGWPKGGSYIKGLIKRLFIIGPQTFLLNIQFLYLPLFGVIASLHALYWKDKSYLIPSVWLITLLIMFNFFTTSFSYYAPLPLFERYLYLICFPAIIISAGFFDKLLLDEDVGEDGTLKERKFWGYAALSILVALGGYHLAGEIKYAKAPRGWAKEAQVISRIVSPKDPIYTDILTIKSLEFNWKYPANMATIDFEGIDGSEKVPAGSYVFIHKRAVGWLKVNESMWLNKGDVYKMPYFYNDIPQSWETVWEGSSATLYKVQ